MDSPLLTPKEVQRLLKVSLATVYNMADRNELRCVRWENPGKNGTRAKRTTRFKKTDILEFIAKNYK